MVLGHVGTMWKPVKVRDESADRVPSYGEFAAKEVVLRRAAERGRRSFSGRPWGWWAVGFFGAVGACWLLWDSVVSGWFTGDPLSQGSDPPASVGYLLCVWVVPIVAFAVAVTLAEELPRRRDDRLRALIRDEIEIRARYEELRDRNDP